MTKTKSKSQPRKVEPITADEAHDANENALMFRFRPEDLAVASLSIVQPNSLMPEARKHIGEFYNNLYREFYKGGVEIIIAAFDTPRSLKRAKQPGEKYDPKEKPLCASANGVLPYKQYVGTEYQGENIPAICDGCPFKDDGQCREFYKYFGLQVSNLKRVAFKPTYLSKNEAKRLNDSLREDAMNGEIYSYRLTVTDEVNDQWFTFIAERERLIEDKPMIAEIIGLNKAYEQQRALYIGNVNLMLNDIQS